MKKLRQSTSLFFKAYLWYGLMEWSEETRAPIRNKSSNRYLADFKKPASKRGKPNEASVNVPS
jgi:hypothetical protein